MTLEPGEYVIRSFPLVSGNRVLAGFGLYRGNTRVYNLGVKPVSRDVSVPRDHIKLVVGEDGSVTVRPAGSEEVSVVTGDVSQSLTEEGVNIEDSSLVDLGDVRIEIANLSKGGFKSMVEREAGKVAKTSLAYHQLKDEKKVTVTDIVEEASKIAENAVNVVKMGELTEYATASGKPVSVVTASAFTALFKYIWSNREALSRMGVDEVSKFLSEDPKLVEVVEVMQSSVEKYDNGKWVKVGVNKNSSELAKAIASSKVFALRVKEVASMLAPHTEENFNVVYVLRAYAKSINTVGMLTPALLSEDTRKAVTYLSRMDALLTGETTPLTELEKVVVKNYKLSPTEVEKLEIANSLTHEDIVERKNREKKGVELSA